MLKKISITIKGHPTSITLEEEFWNILVKIAQKLNISIASLIASIDDQRVSKINKPNLSSAIRVYILNYIIKHKL